MIMYYWFYRSNNIYVACIVYNKTKTLVDRFYKNIVFSVLLLSILYTITQYALQLKVNSTIQFSSYNYFTTLLK